MTIDRERLREFIRASVGKATRGLRLVRVSGTSHGARYRVEPVVLDEGSSTSV